MTAVLGASPVVVWTPATQQRGRSETPRFARIAGALVGAGASWILGLGLVATFPTRPSLGWQPSSLGPALAVGFGFAMVGSAIPIPASIAGALIAPLAWRARSVLGWIGVAAALAFVTLLVGAATIATYFSAVAVLSGQPAADVVGEVLGSVLIVIFGLMFIGPMVLPFTVAGALLWAALMWLVIGLARGCGIEAPRSTPQSHPQPR